MVRRNGAGTPAILALDRVGVAYRVHQYEHDPHARGYGEEAADKLGVSQDRVFKTIVLSTDRGLAVAVVPVSTQLDLKAVARALGTKKADLAAPALAERSTGMVVGGISPIGQRRSLPTVIDESATEQPTIFVSAGRRGLDLELEPTALQAVVEAVFARIARRG